MKKHIIAILGVFLGIAFGSAEADAQEYSYFNRGKAAAPFTLRHNGHMYWQSPEYQEGSIFYEGKYYDGLDMNINAADEVILVRRKGDVQPVEIRVESIRWARIGETEFVNIDNSLYELCYNGKYSLLRKVGKKLLSSVSDMNGKGIGYNDPHYDSKVINYFSFSEAYYVTDGTSLDKVKKKSDIYKLFPEKKKELRSYARKSGISSYKFPQFAAALLEYVGGSASKAFALDFSFDGPGGRYDEFAAGILDRSSSNDYRIQSTDLAADWFREDGEDGSVVKYRAGSTVNAIYQSKVYELGDRNSTPSGKVMVSGHAYNNNTGDTVPGVVVYDEKTHTYATADNDGYFELMLPLGDNTLVFSEYAMEDFKVMVSVFNAASLNVQMQEKTELLESARIAADSRANHKTTKMGLEKLSIKTIKNVPTAFGEGDVLKAVQSLPGVQSVGEASSGINVRGGSADQNLILFNGNTIYNPSHMFGIFSSFNPDIVDNVELYKSSMPVEYGGRISSVMEVTSKKGDREKIKGSAGIGILTSHVALEGPIGKKTTFVLGGRTTYSDYLLGMLPHSSEYSDGKAGFSDANISLTHEFNEKNSLTFNAYWADDDFSFSGDTVFNYSSANASLLWESKLGEKTGMAVSAGYDHYGNKLTDSAYAYTSYQLRTGIDQAFAKASFKTEVGAHTLSYGASATGYFMNSGELSALGELSGVQSRSLPNEQAVESAVWAGDTWNITEKFAFDFGGRYTAFYNASDKKYYATPEGRVSLKYTPDNNLSFKMGFGSNSQYINLISNTSSISPMDTWKLADGRIRPQTGYQAAAGGYLTAFNGQVDFSLEGYWKRSRNYLDYKSGAVLVMNENLADDLLETTGKAYGVEFMVKKSVGNLNGWVSYTWSRSLLRQQDELGHSAINNGKWYSAPFDKPHDLKLVANYKFTHRYSLSMNVDYSTGRPVTIPVGVYMYGGKYRLAYSDRNAYRIPDYFRIDLAFNVEPGHYLKALTHYSWTFGVYNVTGRHNAYSVFYTANEGKVQGNMLSVFATQIPYVNINIKF